MPSKIQPLRTSQFTERAPLIALGALGVLGVALVISPFFSRRLVQTGISVEPEDVVQLEPVQPRTGQMGAMRIDATAQLPDNTWAIFEVQVLDSQGNLLTSAIKQAWKESGTWYEEGESGTWSEQDRSGRFDIRQANLETPLIVAIALLEHGTVSGQDLDSPLIFHVTIRDGIIDRRFIWSGALGALVLAVLSAIAVKNAGRVAIANMINDSDVVGRETVGGADSLVRVIIRVVSDETSPPTLKANLAINNSYGELVYRCQIPISLSFRKEEGKIEGASGECTLDLILEPKDSYGFSVEITPDGPVDQTFLTVKDGIRTLVPTDIIHIQSPTS